MPAITISREMGSLGTAIARSVAESLGYRVMGYEVINEAAARSGTPEMALAALDDLDLLGLKPSFRQRQAYHRGVRQVMLEQAAEGDVVLVGRGGQVILQDCRDVLHVRVVAPLALRIERVAAAQSIPLAAARAQVSASDRARRSYLRRYYHVNLNDIGLYDLVLNTRGLTVAAAADVLVQAWSQHQSLHGHERTELLERPR
ncbi:MAG: cytidylate kinase-like family protein [Anaerolineae bacterium]|jgi:cytidylate kinase|nr:cytidylate kinase-like family protein [Anaerolineae bacterium]